MKSKLSILSAPSYDLETLLPIVRKSFDNIGGISSFVKKGMKVALKVNLVMGKAPEYAVTTHPALVEAVAELVLEAGGEVLILDGPGNLHIPEMLKRIYKSSGLTYLGKKEGIKLNLDTSDIEYDAPESKYLKKMILMKPLMDADLVINMPKMKTHCQMTFTGAVKNMFGSIPGLLKMEYHFKTPNYDAFADTLIDIFLAVKPAISIMDGILGMHGDGPTSGKPVQIGAILASTDAFALDFAAATIMGIPIEKIPVLKQGAKRSLAPTSLSEIELVGESIEKFVRTDLDIPKTKMGIHFLGGIWGKFLKSILEPKIHFSSRCVRCGYCAKICPAKAITMTPTPKTDHKKCIGCYCCHELCPSAAVELKRFFLLEWLTGGKKE